MKPLNGKDGKLWFFIDDAWIPVLCAIQVGFNYRREEILKTSINSGKFVERTVGLIDYAINLSGLTKIDNSDGVLSKFFLMQLFITGVEIPYQLRYTDSDSNNQTISGNVVITEGSLLSDFPAFTTASITLLGTGNFGLTTVDDPEPTDVFKYYLVTTAGTNTVSSTDIHAVLEVLACIREEGVYEEVTGTPVGRQFKYTDGVTEGTLTFDAALPFNPGELVYVLVRKAI